MMLLPNHLTKLEPRRFCLTQCYRPPCSSFSSHCPGFFSLRRRSSALCIGSRQAAYVRSLVGVAVTYSITIACSYGSLPLTCGCLSRSKLPPFGNRTYEWGECSHDVSRAATLASNFIIAGEEGEDEETSADDRLNSLANVHNYEAGTKVITGSGKRTRRAKRSSGRSVRSHVYSCFIHAHVSRSLCRNFFHHFAIGLLFVLFLVDRDDRRQSRLSLSRRHLVVRDESVPSRAASVLAHRLDARRQIQQGGADKIVEKRRALEERRFDDGYVRGHRLGVRELGVAVRTEFRFRLRWHTRPRVHFGRSERTELLSVFLLRLWLLLVHRGEKEKLPVQIEMLL